MSKLFYCSECPIISCDCEHRARKLSETVLMEDDKGKMRICIDFARKHEDKNHILEFSSVTFKT